MRETEVQITYGIATANCTTDLQFVIKILSLVPTGDQVENTKIYFEIYFVFLAVYKVATVIKVKHKYCSVVIRYSLAPQSPVYCIDMVRNIVDEVKPLQAN